MRKKRRGATEGSSLRAKYKADPKAREFLEKHPEFTGFEAEQYDGLTEYVPPLNAAREEEYETIMQHLHRYPDAKIRRVLEAYYEHHSSIGKIAQMLNLSKLSTSPEILRAKRKVLAFIKEQRVDLGSAAILGERKLRHLGVEKSIFLVVINGVPLWVSDNGAVLEDALQAYLKGEK